jgi:hypothetical protein
MNIVLKPAKRRYSTRHLYYSNKPVDVTRWAIEYVQALWNLAGCQRIARGIDE